MPKPAQKVAHTSAETAYLFRHAVLRDAAYEMQMPSDRATLHKLAAEVMGEVFVGALAPVAGEIAAHWAAAPQSAESLEHERVCLELAGEHARTNWDHDKVTRVYTRLAEIGDNSQVGQSLQFLAGWDFRFHKNVARGRRNLRRLLRHARRIESMGLVAQALHMIATTTRTLGKLRLNRLALRIAVKAEAWLPAGIALGNIGMKFKRNGENRKAARTLRRAIALHRRAGNPAGVGFFGGFLASCLHEMGHTQEALEQITEAIDTLRAAGGDVYLPDALHTLAKVCVSLGRRAEALAAVDEMEVLYEKMHLNTQAARCDLERGLILLDFGAPEDAQAAWHRGVQRLAGSAVDGLEDLTNKMREKCRAAGLQPFG